jgi:multiple sugar transport system permease protein
MAVATRTQPTSAAVPAHRRRLKPRRIIVPAVAYLVAAVMLLPVWWMVSQSLTPEREIYAWPLRLVPQSPTTENYYKVFERPDLPIMRWYFNSIFTSFASTVLVVIVSSMAGYGYSRLEFPGREILFFGILTTMMIPGAVTLIPVFIILRQLGMIDTYWALILPHAAGAFGVFMMRQFFQTLPRELDEAAVLDGATRWDIYWRIAMPLSRAAVAALGIFVFLGSWNDFLWPFIATNSNEMRTLPVGLTVFVGEYWSERGLVMAGATIATLPVLVVYALFQKQIIQGFVLSGLKG